MSISSFALFKRTHMLMRSIGRLAENIRWKFLNVSALDTYGASPSYVLYNKRL